jgi:hypothetical protein
MNQRSSQAVSAPMPRGLDTGGEITQIYEGTNQIQRVVMSRAAQGLISPIEGCSGANGSRCGR